MSTDPLAGGAPLETPAPPATVIHSHHMDGTHFGTTVSLGSTTAKTARGCYRMLRLSGAGRHCARAAVVQLISAGKRESS